MIDKNKPLTIDCDLHEFDPENETGHSATYNYNAIVKSAPKYKLKVVSTDPESKGLMVKGMYKDLFRWVNDWFKICGAKSNPDNALDEEMFDEMFFLDEVDQDGNWLEEATKPTDMQRLMSDDEFSDEDWEPYDDDNVENNEFGEMEWETGELESEAGSVVIQAILELIDDQIERLGYRFDEWMEEKKEEGYTDEEEMHDAIEYAYTRIRQAIENLNIQED